MFMKLFKTHFNVIKILNLSTILKQIKEIESAINTFSYFAFKKISNQNARIFFYFKNKILNAK